MRNTLGMEGPQSGSSAIHIEIDIGLRDEVLNKYHRVRPAIIAVKLAKFTIRLIRPKSGNLGINPGVVALRNEAGSPLSRKLFR